MKTVKFLAFFFSGFDSLISTEPPEVRFNVKRELFAFLILYVILIFMAFFLLCICVMCITLFWLNVAMQRFRASRIIHIICNPFEEFDRMLRRHTRYSASAHLLTSTVFLFVAMKQVADQTGWVWDVTLCWAPCYCYNLNTITMWFIIN